MKSFFTFIALSACFIAGCKKDSPEPEKQDDKPVPEEVVSGITSELSEADSISSFVAAFGNIQLTEAEVSEGITVFAPLNEEKMPATKAADPVTKADEAPVIRDHVVKGVFKLADLIDGKVLTSLSGKKLRIKREEDQIWINGVAMSGEGIVTAGGQVVFIVKESLTGTTENDEPEPAAINLTIVVWDATGWDPSSPNGVPAAGADVVLYKSHEDYVASNHAYMAEAGEDGKVVFENIEPGTYYIHAGLDYKSNVILESDRPQNGVFTGMAIAGIIDSESELIPGELLGNFQYVDANTDGQVNNLDRLPVPYESATINGGETPEVNVYIGYINNQYYKSMTLEGVRDQLGQLRQRISTWHKMHQVLLDAVLSDDAAELPGALSNYLAGIDNFTFNAATPVILQFWRQGFESISTLNRLAWELDNMIPGSPALLGQVKGMRAYIYLQLMSYFGEVPYDEGIVWQEADYNFETDRERLFSFISADLSEALSLLPQETGDKTLLSANAIKALQAKVAMMKEDFNAVDQLTAEIINSGFYTLETGPDMFAADSKEFIWNDASGVNTVFSQFFFNRGNCPYLRLTGIYLMRAEAVLHQGNIPGALEIVRLLCNRSGWAAPASDVSSGDLRTFLHLLWQVEMSREGSRYVNLVRWGEAADVLGEKGFMSHHVLLPVPQLFLDSHPQALQNPGY